MIGFFVNTLVLRADLSGDPSFEVLLDRVKSMTLGAYEHQDVPFEHLVDALSVERDMSRSPLFQVMFALQNAPMGSIASSDIEMRGLPVEGVISKFDLSLELTEIEDGIIGKFEYNTDLFDGLTIERLSVHFEQLLRGLVADPSSRISEIEMLTQAERIQQLVEWNDTSVDYPSERCIHELFEAQVKCNPDAVALVYAGSVLTYGELNARSNQLAHYLLGRGVVTDGLVGICMDRSLEMVIGILGVLKSGSGYVPIDPGYPRSRIGYMLSDSGVGWVLTNSDQAIDLIASDSSSRDSIECIELSNLGSGYSVENPGVELSSANIAYVIYTSGSTGLPKGVVSDHASMLNRLHWSWREAPYADGEVCCHKSALSFVDSITELFSPLLQGVPSILVSKETVLETERFISLLLGYRVSRIVLVPSLLVPLLFALAKQRLPGLRYWVVSGERLTSVLLEGFYSLMPEVHLNNFYGSSEVAADALTYSTLLEDVESKYWNSVPIGKPISNINSYVLDGDQGLVPQGVLGELYIGGDGLARGYLNRGGLTAAKFIPNPFGGEGDRLYRTGDIVRYLADGNIEYIGRVDHQVKVRGFRIELGEIESSLLSHECVKESVVLARTESGDTRLVGYVVLSDEVEGSALRDYLKDRLPDYMVPNVLMVVDEFPLTPNGKLDRNALPSPEPGVLTDAYVAPRTDIELTLSQIWSEVLGVDRVGIHDNFFELGGHSLLATRVISALRQHFEIELPLSEIFSGPTVRQLASSIGIADKKKYGNIDPVKTRDYYPVSKSQLSLWLYQKLNPQSSAYHAHATVEIVAEVDASNLEMAIKQLVNRHEILRTTFSEQSGFPVQIIHQYCDVTVGIEEIDSVRALNYIINEHVNIRFDLEKGPLLRAILINTWDQRKMLHWCIHEIIGDGTSVQILKNELNEVVKNSSKKQSFILPKPRLQYKDFAIWQNNFLESDYAQIGRDYWHNQLKQPLPASGLPYDYPLNHAVSMDGASYRVTVSKYVLDRLKKLAQKEGVTLFMLLQAAFVTLLYRLSGQTDIVIASPVSGRDHLDIKQTIGYFVNTLLFRFHVDPEKQFSGFLNQVKNVVLEGLTHQYYPFDQILDELNIRREPNKFPVTPVLLNMLNILELSSDVDHGLVGHGHVENKMKVELETYIHEGNNGLSLFTLYRTALFKPKSIEYFFDEFILLLEQITINPALSINKYKLFQNNMTAEVSPKYHFNSPYLYFQKPFENMPKYNVLNSINAVCQQTPDAVAIESNKYCISYRELDIKSNQIANSLIKNGLNRQIICVFVDNPIDIIIGILGVLKAGCVFVILDADVAGTINRRKNSGLDIRAYLSCECLIPKLDIIRANSHSDALLILIDDGFNPDTYTSFTDNYVQANRYSRGAVNIDIQADDPCYIFFTSGSAGTPKPILGRVDSLGEFVDWEINTFKLKPGCRISQLTVPTFDPFLRDIIVPLSVGGIICLPPNRSVLLDPNNLIRWIDEARIELIHCIPTILSNLFYGELSGVSFTSLKYILLAGEVLLPELVRSWHKNFADRIELVNIYGPTECTLAKVFHRVSSSDLERSTIPIGKPMRGARVILFDENGAICPAGSVGEIFISTPYFSHGYYMQPGNSASRFIPDSISKNGGRLYRTGDLGRIVENGDIEFLGRVDRQIKIAGIRIEPREIESQLLEFDGIKEVVVLAQNENTKHIKLFAYISTMLPLEENEIRAFIERRLQPQLIPSRFIILDEFPRLENGKVDINSLPDPSLKGNLPDLTERETKGQIEKLLQQIWCNILQLEYISRDDNFFHIGGQSLLAVQVIARINELYETDFSVRELFDFPTIKHLAIQIENNKNTGNIFASTKIELVDRSRSLPLSFSQQRVWYLEQISISNSGYNLFYPVKIIGKFNLNAFELALSNVIRRHEILRTTYSVVDGEVNQMISSSTEISLPIIDLSNLPEVKKQNTYKKILSKKSAKSINLESGPVIDISIIQMNGTESYLMLMVHHIAFDLRSRDILMTELFEYYHGYLTNTFQQSPDLPFQFADYAYWQRSCFNNNKLDVDAEYWRNKLVDVSELLALPFDYDRPEIQTQNGAIYTVELKNDLYQSIEQQCRENNVTLFMYILSAFKIILAQYSRQNDICVGTPVSNRQHRNLENLIGFFVNTLVIRTDVRKSQRFTELLVQVRRNLLDAFSHQDMPFEQIVNELNLSRNFSFSPIFQVMFSLNTVVELEATNSGLEIEPINLSKVLSKFDLSLEAIDNGNRIQLVFVYNTDLFKGSTIERMGAHLELLLACIVTNPQSRIREIEMLTEVERDKQLVNWNNTVVDYPSVKNIQELFEEQVVHNADAIALVYDAEVLTYSELNARSNQLAHYLLARGVVADGLVGICMNRSLDMVIGILAVLKSGGAYLPIDPNYPQSRIEYMLSDSGVKILLISQQLTPVEYSFKGETISIERDWDLISRQPLTNLDTCVDKTNLMYVIYTSGSTGLPKGVMIDRNALQKQCLVISKKYHLNAGDRVLQFASISFDPSIEQLFTSLLSGCSAYISNGTIWSAEDLFEFIDKHQLTIVDIPPVYWRSILDLNDMVYESVTQNSLRLLNFGGDRLFQYNRRKWLNSPFRRAELVNSYGPTEATITALTYGISDDVEETLENIPIGRPLDNRSVFILDENLSLLPQGVLGELYLGGEGLARGYLNRGGLTAEKFIPNPFSDKGDRLYRTGDIVRYLADGNIEYIGRVDHQVKVRGFRIELGEIESSLLSHECVKESVVLARTESGDTRLVGYVVLSSEFDTSELREYLKNRLPDYMVPNVLMVVDEFPLTPNGKLDRNALPSPELGVLTDAYVAPRTDIELTLSQIWSEVLGVDRVGIKDNFFELGGHSLLAVKYISKINAEFGVKLGYSAIFEYSNIEKMAKILCGSDHNMEKSNLVILQSEGQSPPLFLIHPVSGNVFCYNYLAKQLGKKQPVYGIQYSGFYSEMLESSLEELAASYLKIIISKQKYGPFRIGGWSIGGLIAYEMVKQLEHKNITDSKLILLDTWAPDSLVYNVSTNIMHLGIEFLNDIILTQNSDRRKIMPEDINDIDEIESLFQKSVELKVLPESLSAETLSELFNDYYANINALNEYQSDYKVQSAMLITTKNGHNDDQGWRNYVERKLEINNVAGDHYSLLNDINIRAWKSKLNRYLLTTTE